MIDFRNVKSVLLPEGVVSSISLDGKTLWRNVKYKRELSYIESSGSQWINTQIYPTDSSIKSEVKIAYSSTATGQLMGAGHAGSERFNFGIESGRFRFGFGGGWFDANSEVVTADTEPHVWVLDASTKSGSIDGIEQKTSNVYSPRGSYVYALFARGMANAAESSNRTKGKLYYAKLWNVGELVRDFIPVLDLNNVPCLYDKVSGQLFYNNGTGEFGYGELWHRLPSEYQEVRYLESTGTQYIDTGVSINTATDSVELDFQNKEDRLYKWLFGEHDNAARFGLGSGDGADKRNVAYGATTYKVKDSQQYNAKHTFVANEDGAFIDGAKVTGFASFSSASTIYLFSLNLNGGDYATKAKIWNYKHKRGGSLVRNLVPCYRKSDNKPGMYDLASKAFFTNAGTGEFVVGNDLNGDV